jgi:hypothetical protein
MEVTAKYAAGGNFYGGSGDSASRRAPKPRLEVPFAPFGFPVTEQR